MIELNFYKQRVGIIACYLNRHRAGRPNLLILHGALGEATRLFHLGPLLADFNLLFCDLRGHGQSDWSATGYDAATMAKDLLQAVSTIFGLNPFFVIGESFSGIIALELSKICEGLKGIIMVDTPFDNERTRRSMIALSDAYHRRKQQSHAIAGMAREYFGFDIKTDVLRPVSYLPHLSNVSIPILMITGSSKAADQQGMGEPGAYFMQSDVDAVKQYTPHFAHIEIAGAGHRLLKTHPDKFAKILRLSLSRKPD